MFFLFTLFLVKSCKHCSQCLLALGEDMHYSVPPDWNETSSICLPDSASVKPKSSVMADVHN